jgi:hypothetical protein
MRARATRIIAMTWTVDAAGMSIRIVAASVSIGL